MCEPVIVSVSGTVQSVAVLRVRALLIQCDGWRSARLARCRCFLVRLGLCALEVGSGSRWRRSSWPLSSARVSERSPSADGRLLFLIERYRRGVCRVPVALVGQSVVSVPVVGRRGVVLLVGV